MRELIHSGQLAGHRAVVVGAGTSGLAACRLLSALGATIRLVDKAEPAPAARQELESLRVKISVGPHTAKDFQGAQMVVLSPGVNPHTLAPALADVAENALVAEMELASWFVGEPVVAVTGTSGKTTTASAIAHLLEQAGRKVFLGGNIGTPLSDYVLSGQRAEVVVLEVSSFQLLHVRSLKPHVAVLTNLAPNHLDYHRDMAEYRAAKLSLFSRMTDRDLAILPLTMKEELEAAPFTKARRVYYTATNRFPESPLLGAHNAANLEAAWLAARALGVGDEQARAAVASYQPHPHRLQRVAEKKGILLVDDSKATTVDALAAALRSFDRPIRLLAGGVFKGGDLAALAPVVRERVAAVGLFGASREIFEDAWSGIVPLFWEPTLEAAMRRHWAEARPGDVILLAPATASFDQYANYKARGADFQRVAEELS